MVEGGGGGWRTAETSFRPAPTARHSLTLGRASSAGHGLPGATPPGPPGTHV
ncbi:hypothetical protein K443DRAFT_13832 [Laccaria amethystina LaAM-08-1]|uniref:Uncharacterized protein n=1 Tax=Laccaria amethystina LaAM-08-1 TaxID=1095629 RepID=A0A0C9X6S5_9AGAR|nr:hypothetical protein K443DRAFT_13832 [Laccaria amethystina LaAM-08-1]